jgi:hypothetical protein
VFDSDLTKKIKMMSEYLDYGAIAAALRIPVDTVHDIIKGNVSISKTETEKEMILQVAARPVYRQRVISVWRGRGGAGCTTIALHLSYLLQQVMSVLVVDLHVSGTGSDLGYYLHLPEYPNLEALSQGGYLSAAVIQVEAGLWALLPPTTGAIDKAMVDHLVAEARKDFDAVIFDLPNTDDEFVLEAAACSNALLMVVNGLSQEMNRALARKIYAQKEAVLVANGCPGGINTGREYVDVVAITEDKDLQSRMERGVFYKKGAPLTLGAEKIRDSLFGMRPFEGSGLAKMMRRLLVGAVVSRS